MNVGNAIAAAQDLVFHQIFFGATQRFAERLATVDGEFSATFAIHRERVLSLADGLRRHLGVGRGQPYAVMALNSHHFLELWHAGLLGAGIVNPLNLRLAPKELKFILQDSGTKVVFVDPIFAPLIDSVREDAGVDQVILIGSGDVPHDATIDEIMAAGAPVVPPEPDETDPAILMYTGGTTGLPKGVLIQQRAAILDMYKIATQYMMSPDYVYLHQTPMFHAASLGGVLMVPAAGGTTTFIPAFNPGGVLDLIERHRVNITVMVPTMIQMLLDHPDFRPERLASLKILTYGASPMPTALLERLLGLLPGLDIYQGYGMTENCGLLTMLGPADHRRGGDLLKSAGLPLAGNVVSIQDSEGSILASGEVGEVCARGGNLMREYWKRPDETAAAFAGGWYHTGDAGRLDDRGYLYLVDRVKDMIVTGGENVYSVEVENALMSHPAVVQVAVIGIPSEQWGEAVHAIVVLREQGKATVDELRAWARDQIAGYKVPRSFEFRGEPLPLSGAMKVLKRDLREKYWRDRDRSV